MSKAAKPRKAAKEATKAPARKRAARTADAAVKPSRRNRPEGFVRKSDWKPAKDHPSPIGRALHVAITAFGHDKGQLSEWLGVHRPNLSRALHQCKLVEEGQKPLVDKDGKPTRIGFKVRTDGTKVRVAKRSGAEIDG